jgi:hypothetical protein
MGLTNDVQVTQIALQSKFSDAREKDQKINCLHFQINQAQQSVKTDIELAKAMAPGNMNDELWKDVLEGRKKVKELGAQLVQMEMQNAKPSEKLQIVNNFLRNAAPKRPAMTVPLMTPTGSSSKAAHSETCPAPMPVALPILQNFCWNLQGRCECQHQSKSLKPLQSPRKVLGSVLQ